MQLSAADFIMLWKAVDVIEAQEHIALTRAIMYPKLKPSARKERDTKMYKTAYPRDIYKKEAKDSSFLLQKLGGKRGGQQ